MPRSRKLSQFDAPVGGGRWRALLSILAIAVFCLPIYAQDDAPKKSKKTGSVDPYIQEWSNLYAAGAKRLESFNFEALRRAIKGERWTFVFAV